MPPRPSAAAATAPANGESDNWQRRGGLLSEPTQIKPFYARLKHFFIRVSFTFQDPVKCVQQHNNTRLAGRTERQLTWRTCVRVCTLSPTHRRAAAGLVQCCFNNSHLPKNQRDVAQTSGLGITSIRREHTTALS